ncbi:monocarboxylate transporter 12-B-like [Mercenaria mercenaria]|uniref:monocarboxylate transporter 12-B-like n=1 Tax=Mercenaria mercenaria TaxID=6596 RepID=UPI00234FADB4|nr:monocarboxylate transporter 12-B-like [Mercenaria mercenaria]
MFYVCPLIALGHTLVMKLQTLKIWMIAACIVHGFGFGILIAMTPVVIYDLVGHEKFLQALSQLLLVIGIANLLCNFVGGSIRDVYGTYDLAYELGVAAALLAALGFLVMACVTKKHHRKEDLLQQHYFKTTPYNSIN